MENIEPLDTYSSKLNIPQLRYARIMKLFSIVGNIGLWIFVFILTRLFFRGYELLAICVVISIIFSLSFLFYQLGDFLYRLFYLDSKNRLHGTFVSTVIDFSLFGITIALFFFSRDIESDLGISLVVLLLILFIPIFLTSLIFYNQKFRDHIVNRVGGYYQIDNSRDKISEYLVGSLTKSNSPNYFEKNKLKLDIFILKKYDKSWLYSQLQNKDLDKNLRLRVAIKLFPKDFEKALRLIK